MKKSAEPPRNKVHWDYLLDEMGWMSTDFNNERKWKSRLAKKIMRAVISYHGKQQALPEREAKLELVRRKKGAAVVARLVKKFWLNIGKLVQFKRNETLNQKKSVDLNRHLELLVDHTQSLTKMVAKDLVVGHPEDDKDYERVRDTQREKDDQEAFEEMEAEEQTTKEENLPALLRHGKLREYQHIGLDWLVTMCDNKLNGILADEMGLGKTVQTIAMLAHLACDRGIWGQHLVVVPTSVMVNWEIEFKRWLPGFKILCYHGDKKERKRKRKGWSNPNTFHVCITSYELIIKDAGIFKRKRWHYLILDEAQNIKNFRSKRWQVLLNFRTERRLLLTGTPLQNNVTELWSLMHFLMPHVFQSQKEFQDWFADPVKNMVEGKETMDKTVISRLHKVLRPFILRRLKKEVAKQMPKKYEHVIHCRLSKRQRILYEEFMANSATRNTLASKNFLGLMNVLMQLRKVCNHPDIFAGRPIISPFDQMQPLSYTFSNGLLAPPPNATGVFMQHWIARRAAEARSRARRLQGHAYRNGIRCSNAAPLIGTDLVDLLTFASPVYDVHFNARDPRKFLDVCLRLRDMILLPSQRAENMRGVLNHFICYIPKARAPPMKMVSYNLNSREARISQERLRALQTWASPRVDIFWPAYARMKVHFPDKRLIQWDCGKLQMLSQLLKTLKSGGHRVLLFTQMTRMLDILEHFLNIYGYNYLRLDGSTKPEQRQRLMERFNNSDKIFIFILSTRSGGVGVNLTGADTVIFYDTDWNPAMDLQAQDRCHRIGQTREVNIYRLVTKNTIEENILKKSNQKRQMNNMVIGDGEFNT
eukprot:jgi/Bigna1/38226/e_gw1.24.8.1